MKEMDAFFLSEHIHNGSITQRTWEQLSEAEQRAQLSAWASEFHADNHRIYELMRARR